MRAWSISIIPFAELKDIVRNSDYKSIILELYHMELLSMKILYVETRSSPLVRSDQTLTNNVFQGENYG